MNITDWEVPQTSTHWSDAVYKITQDCMIRDKVKSAARPVNEYLRLAMNFFFIDTFNTFYANEAFRTLYVWERAEESKAGYSEVM
jgi:hypothetical protein